PLPASPNSPPRSAKARAAWKLPLLLRRVVSHFFPGDQNVPLLQISPKQLREAVVGNPDFDRDGFQLLVREFLPNHLPAPQVGRRCSGGDMILLVKPLK